MNSSNNKPNNVINAENDLKIKLLESFVKEIFEITCMEGMTVHNKNPQLQPISIMINEDNELEYDQEITDELKETMLLSLIRKYLKHINSVSMVITAKFSGQLCLIKIENVNDVFKYYRYKTWVDDIT